MTYIPEVDRVIQHCIRTYGGTTWLKNNVLYIKIGTDLFHVNITDGQRFRKFTLYHQNRQRALDGKRYNHVQLVGKYLDYVVYRAFTHEFNKTLGIESTTEDWQRFRQDALWYYDPWADDNDLGAWFFY